MVDRAFALCARPLPAAPGNPAARTRPPRIAVIIGVVVFLLGWVPIVAILGLVAAGLGIAALVRGQSKAMSIPAIALGVLAFITSVAMAVAFGSGLLGAPAAPQADPARAATGSEPEPAATRTPTPRPTPTPTPTPTPIPTPEPPPGPDLTTFQPLDERAFALDCPVLGNVAQDDHVRMWVTTLGSFSYETQIGANTTEPFFEVHQVELLPKPEY